MFVLKTCLCDCGTCCISLRHTFDLDVLWPEVKMVECLVVMADATHYL